METIFSWLNDALAGAPWLALVAAAGWGVASLVLSPCHLASIPLIVGFIARREETTPRQAFGYAVLFALGILSSIAAVGGVTLLAGRVVGEVGPWANYTVAAVLVLVALHLLEVRALPWQQGLSLPRYQGKAAALLLGLVFGLALGPCTFAFLAPVLGAVFSVANTRPGLAAALLLAYAVGHTVLIVAAGASVERVQRVLAWHGQAGGARWLRRACGALVLAGAIWLVATAN